MVNTASTAGRIEITEKAVSCMIVLPSTILFSVSLNRVYGGCPAFNYSGLLSSSERALVLHAMPCGKGQVFTIAVS